ncbi:MAG: hypothetical protein P1Q69_09630 [Candidatus Thorarchaeota archaeon]|nr:hypothetical protein [Candidatus Thorarchaeota archaeon]
MSGKESIIDERNRKYIVRASLSKSVFPEVCPVCMEEAEDLVAIIIMETRSHWNETRGLVSGWTKPEDKGELILSEARGGTTFWIPACLQHGSDSMTTPKKKVLSAVGFMVLFYPLLYFILGALTAREFSRPLLPILGPMVFIIALMVIDIMYGFYPRAIERNIRFLDINRAKDEVMILLKNNEYRDLFLESNPMHAALLENMKTDNDAHSDIGGT